MLEVQHIQKEEIAGLKFPKADVLATAAERKERFSKLEKAMLLGNGYKVKVKIVFDSVDSTYIVETTVWEASEDDLMLKGDVHIPIHCIRDVEL